jgi:hypothetical protein
VVSDDIEWCKDNIKSDNITFTPFKDEISDLYLMTQCEHKIMSNSSFSWWGVWLSKKSGVVVSPNKWFNYNGPQDFNDIYLDSWVKI